MTTEIDFDELVPRLRGRETIHPESTMSFSVSKRVLKNKIPITEETPLVVYAWEFLRRNRFYQALIDKRKEALPASEWGFRGHPLEPKTHGLFVLKPYWEEYSQGDPPNWLGLDTFAKRTEAMISDKPQEVTIQLLPGQVAVVFDTYGLLNGRSPVEIQTSSASFYLSQRAEEKYQIKTIKKKSFHRKVLLRRWQLMVRLYDKGQTFNSAAKDLAYPTKVQKRLGKRQPATFGSSFDQLSQEPVTTAFEDAGFIYGYVYRHGYVDMLAGNENYVIENGRLAPSNYSKTIQAFVDKAMSK